MKTTIKILTLAAAVCGACDSGDDGPAVDEAEAARVAEVAAGGEARESVFAGSGDSPAWVVSIVMPNGATVEARVDADNAQLLELEAFTGPFEYDFTPVDGVLSYMVMKTAALAEVAGDVEAWKFVREADEEDAFEFEFYVRDEGEQLWEVKFDAVTGTATDIEEKESVDE